MKEHGSLSRSKYRGIGILLAAAAWLFTGAATAEELSRSAAFQVQQIITSVETGEGHLEKFHGAERPVDAKLALRAAEGAGKQAQERLEQFRAKHPELVSHPDAQGAAERVEALDTAIGEAGRTMARGGPNQPDAGALTAATADARRITELKEKYSRVLDAVHGNSLVYYGTAEAAAEAKKTLDEAEQAAAAIRPALAAFSEAHGVTREEIAQSLESQGAEMDTSVHIMAGRAVALREFLQKIADSRDASAESIVDEVRGRMADIEDYSDKRQMQRLTEAGEMLAIGREIAPNNPAINQLSASLSQLTAARSQANEARIDQARWPGHVPSFQGPGSASDLARATRDYLRADRDWGRNEQRPQEILEVAVRGSWQVAKHDLFGRPVQWRLPVAVAVTDAELEPKGIAQVYELSMVARKGSADSAPKAPPWDGFWVGDNHFMRIKALP